MMIKSSGTYNVGGDSKSHNVIAVYGCRKKLHATLKSYAALGIKLHIPGSYI